MLVTRSAGSDLIVALCKAGWARKALLVYRDMMASAWGTSTGAAKHSKPGPSQHEAEPPLQPPSLAHSEASSASAPSQKSSQHAYGSAAHSRAEGCSESSAGDGDFLTESEACDSDQDRGEIEIDSEQGTDSPTIHLVRPFRMPSADRAATPASPLAQGAGVQPRETSGSEQRRQGLVWKAKVQEQRTSSQQVMKQKGQPILIPHIAAVGALVGALARSGDLNTALELYAQVPLLNLQQSPI